MAIITGGLPHQLATAHARLPQVTTTPAGPTSRPALQAADRLVAAPATPAAHPPTALDVVPQDWLPYGNSERSFEARSGFIKVMSGKAQIHRTADLVSVKTPRGNFAFRPDKAHPDCVVATTPQGTFSGRLVRSGNLMEFHASDGRHGLKVEKKSDGIRFDTQGFGALDMGHLTVKNQ